MAESTVEIGESFIGTGANAAHINTVFGDRNGPVGTAWATALATPSSGHVPFMAVLKPGVPVKPVTLFVTKAAPASDEHGVMIWGPAQAGVAGGVADAVASGVITGDAVDAGALVVAVWVNPAADDADEVYRNNREATMTALTNGAQRLPSTDEVLAARQDLHNPFYTPPA
ncbi:aldehyde-activating protein [Nocardioides psychrotolerans]|uniref:5,6,7,8-tetrahydromethanopterin hydro-lyase n=1 Tax=Nocardioides psychrotolerans TaxID=1005945 RepID=A0A1I3HK25_9ACTN|nr:formaldehyde-activating enzyme [Nocardioides psychrotolerans]GEP40002.1 aldehyde-activating protein [Nocardioides psychrotolerans]SFI35969.1 5,6,7,8-tetrahydromethanopterin hydro-lyase [Nocardioides psychrotolerans]